MVEGYQYRVVAGALAGAVLFTGCASSAPAGRFTSADATQETTCVQPTREAAGQPSWVHAMGYGIAGVAIGALWGASDGVSWGFATGANSGQAAWIGAAAGAGLGLMIGLVSGAIKGRDGWPSHRAADRACAADTPPAGESLARAADAPTDTE